MSYLFDTDVLSELCRSSPSHRVSNFVQNCAPGERFVSVVTLAELRRGIELVSDVDKRERLQRWLIDEIRPQFVDRELAVSEEVMMRWLALVHAGRKAGHTYSQPDLLIAATALHHGLTLVTRNTADFVLTGVTMINPWLL